MNARPPRDVVVVMALLGLATVALFFAPVIIRAAFAALN